MESPVCRLALFLLLFSMIVSGVALAVPDVVRVHVIANSDNPQDQRAKDKVRDYIVEQVGLELVGMDFKSGQQWLYSNRDSFVDMANHVLAIEGEAYTAKATFGVASYPTRAYGGQIYPAGKYKSLQVVLGEGEGKNWWCVLFPPLCFVQESIAENQQQQEQQQVEIRFWVVEKIKDLFRGLLG